MTFNQSRLLVFVTLFSTIATTLSANYETLVKGQKFLEENAKEAGVVVLDNGLQYRVLVEGEGDKPSATDIVKVYYHGYLLNGKEFDGTDIIRPPAVFQVGNLIKGWTQALQLMPEGSIWELWIPSELAYGSKGSPPSIPADSTLYFEVELVSIVR